MDCDRLGCDPNARDVLPSGLEMSVVHCMMIDMTNTPNSQQSANPELPQAYFENGAPNPPQEHAATYAPPQPPVAQGSPAKGFALTALIVGIVAFLIGLVPVAGFLAGAAAAVFGVLALVKNQSRGLAITGLVLGGIALVTSIGVTVGLGAIGNQVSNEREQIETVTEQVEEPEAAAPEAAAPAPAPEPEEPQLTISQKNALRTAENYLNFTSFSRTGLIEQLQFEGYSTEDATFAVDTISPDWNQQAAKKAASYLEFTSFSRQGLIEQLIFEGFTPEQAEAGVSAVGY